MGPETMRSLDEIREELVLKKILDPIYRGDIIVGYISTAGESKDTVSFHGVPMGIKCNNGLYLFDNCL